MSIEKNPYAALLAKLSGVSPPPIRARQGWQQMMHERKDLINPAVSAEWARREETKKEIEDTSRGNMAPLSIEQEAAGAKAAKNHVGFRAEVARSMFTALTKEEQKEYINAAKRDKEKATAAYQVAVESALSSNRSPENRQL